MKIRSRAAKQADPGGLDVAIRTNRSPSSDRINQGGKEGNRYAGVGGLGGAHLLIWAMAPSKKMMEVS